MMSQRIVFTGGGTAGHVTPNFPLIDRLRNEGWQIAYMGSAQGVEAEMIKAKGIPFHAVSSGKLRRYFSWKNFTDPFKIILGVIQAFGHYRRIKPDVVFSKGGFVAFPVVMAAWLSRIPVVAHESDLSPGLANRLCFPFVNKICLTFDAGKKHFKNQKKIAVTGTPLREELFRGDSEKGLELCGFSRKKPCLLVIGGSLGAESINQCVRKGLDKLLQKYQIVHICGKGKIDHSLEGKPGYFQMEFANQELQDLFAAADLVISRSGANSLYELLALAKPHVLIPLSAKASRGDQIQNANYFKKIGVSEVINDDTLTVDQLCEAIEKVMNDKENCIARLKALNIKSATDPVLSVIKEQIHA